MYQQILERASEGNGLGRDEINALLSMTEKKDLKMLFSTAESVKRKFFGNRIYTYGFVYFSTFCKNNCVFCHYRNSHRTERYRKNEEEIAELAQGLEDSGVNLIDLTMGEDPVMYADGYKRLLNVIETVSDNVKVPIMVSPGAVPKDVFPRFRVAGADWFACYQETHNRKLFQSMRIGQDYDIRSSQRDWAMEAGMLAEDGIMVGIGETSTDRTDSLMEMGRQGCDQIRVMTFIPQYGTPMSSVVQADRTDELKIMAVMRLAYPKKLIPASLDVEGIEGLIPRLAAGANVVTSIVPPMTELAGVAQKDLDIDNGMRSMSNVSDMLDTTGCRLGTSSEYVKLIKEFRTKRCSA